MSELAYHEVAKTGDLDEDEMMKVSAAGKEIALYNLGGEFYATDDICTHAYASLSEGYMEGDRVECPLHGAYFEIKTGKAATPPASGDLATYPVKIEDDAVLVGIDTGDG